MKSVRYGGSGVAVAAAVFLSTYCANSRRQSGKPLKDARGRHRPPTQLHFADDVALRDESPVAAVGTVVPMIAHHEVVTLGNHLWAVIVVAAVLLRHEVVGQRDVVHVDL